MTYVVIGAVTLIACMAITGLCVWADSRLNTGFFAAIGFFTGVVSIIGICLVAIAAIPLVAIYTFGLLELIPGM